MVVKVAGSEVLGSLRDDLRALHSLTVPESRAIL